MRERRKIKNILKNLLNHFDKLISEIEMFGIGIYFTFLLIYGVIFMIFYYLYKNPLFLILYGVFPFVYTLWILLINFLERRNMYDG